MFSVTQQKNRTAAPKNNSILQAPRGFAVRVFKGPTLSTFPHTATAKFDLGYRPTVNADPRQTQNWYLGRPEPARQSLSASREPLKPSRFASWSENCGRDTPHPAAVPNYADFIYERSDVYSNSETESNSSPSTPTSIFSSSLTADSALTSTPSEGSYQFPTTSSPRPHPFPLHIPALAQAQSAIRSLFVHPNGDIGQAPSPARTPGAPVSRPAALPDASPPRMFPSGPAAPERSSSPPSVPLSESPQGESFVVLSPPSESEMAEEERLAQRYAQYNSASSAYYQANLRRSESQATSPERAQLGTTARSVASSSLGGGSFDPQGRGVYESSSIMTARSPTSPTVPAAPSRLAFVTSESSSITAVDESGPRPRLDSLSLHARNLNVPVSQLVELGSPIAHAAERERAERAHIDPGRYEELRGLNILSDRQRETFVNAFAPGTHGRAAPPTPFPSFVPAVVRSDSGDDRAPGPERPRRVSGNLWNSYPGPSARHSPPQMPPRSSSTPPVVLPRINTSVSRSSAYMPPTPQQQSQSPQRRDVPPPLNVNRARTPVAGPRVLPGEPQRRRSDGDQPMGFNGHRSPSSEPGVPAQTPAPRPSRPGAMPLDPQRRRSDGFQSVVPPRPTSPPPAPPPPATRNVRWNENLVCPSPIFPSQRPRGWFNRRGDQLWTNEGAYKAAPPGQEFPAELRDYPEFGTGWMNEEGVHIDMGHRLIPKAPLRSALKQPRGPVVQVNQGT